jgi:hypothetical protein
VGYFLERDFQGVFGIIHGLLFVSYQRHLVLGAVGFDNFDTFQSRNRFFTEI